MIDSNDVVLAQRCRIFLRVSVGYLTDRDSVHAWAQTIVPAKIGVGLQ
jgi:hypothetical protein